MNKTEVVNVDLLDVPHVRVEVESEKELEEMADSILSEKYYNVKARSPIFEMSNRFESCFILYRNDAPDMFFYAQE